MREILSEIWSSMRKNKLRTFLTGFSVAWGIFMLIVLLGAGNGLQNGTESNFNYISKNSFQVFRGWTSIPYGGYDKWRSIQLTNSDMELIKSEFSDIVGDITAEGYYDSGTLTYDGNYTEVWLMGVTPSYTDIIHFDILEGRFINDQDNRDRRKVIVIEEETSNFLFPDTSPIGKQVILKDIIYTVVGVYKTYSFGDKEDCIIPLQTGQLIYRANQPFLRGISFTVNGIKTTAQAQDFENRLRLTLAAAHNFSPDDTSAVSIRNNFQRFQSFDMIFSGISLVLWIIGLGTLLAGVVGVSNIMIVTITERTFEFGIRKALGAKPSSIIRLILIESVAITALFGYIGLIGGVFVMEVVNYFVDLSAAGSEEISMFLNPTVNIGTAVSATIVLIIAGLISGYVPAKRAAQLKTIDAMRHNK